MNQKHKNTTLLVIMAGAALFGISSATLLQQEAHASIIGSCGAGYDQGKQDAYNGYARADNSDQGYSYRFCYTAGYDLEVSTIQQVQP